MFQILILYCREDIKHNLKSDAKVTSELVRCHFKLRVTSTEYRLLYVLEVQCSGRRFSFFLFSSSFLI